ncbi:MAG: tRNA(His) guanylyltransferase Thg1 family protein [Clostridia bacterium]|nr:tRNA(His) guanylyltransferase Thg1 family protein [Clostridia bacterium]
MPVHDDLGNRMKKYEAVSKTCLMTRTPVAIRVDGKAFHTFTKQLNKPFDSVFVNAMIQTMETMCEKIQNCIFGYVQSDEITFILKDYEQLNTSAWFDNEVQKLCSVSASMATYYFNVYFREKAEHIIATSPNSEYSDILRRTIISPAMFDARCFNIPREEVINLIYWRQLDAVRNSIQAAGQAKFSHKQLMGKSCKMIKEMLEENGTPWENFPTYLQRGTCAIREGKEWITDYSMPMLVKEGREYLEALI